MKAIKFSNKSNLEKLKQLHPTGKIPLKVFASDCESLCVFVQPQPSLNISYYAHWSVVRYAEDGKVKRQGRYKYICRVGSKPYEVVRQIVVNNIDKWKQERSQSSIVKTVGHLAEAFIKHGTAGFRIKGKTKIKYKARTTKDYESRLKTYLLLKTNKPELISMLTDPFRYSGETYSKGALKDVPLSKLTKKDIQVWHSRMESIPTSANRALATLSVAIEWDMKRTSERMFIQDANPCLRIDKYPETKDKKFVDTIEKVLEVRSYCENEITRDPHYLTFYHLLMEYGERLTDSYNLMWEKPTKLTDLKLCSGWINFRTEEIHLTDSKDRKEADPPLTEEAVKMLKKLQDLKSDPNTKASFAAGSKWVFPRLSDPTKPINDNSYRVKLKKFNYKFGLATRELVKVNKLKSGKNGKRKVYKYKNLLTFKHLRKTFVTWYGREHGEEAASQRMRHSTLKVTRDHYFNADKKKLRVKHMYSTGENVVNFKKAGNDEQ